MTSFAGCRAPNTHLGVFAKRHDEQDPGGPSIQTNGKTKCPFALLLLQPFQLFPDISQLI